MENDAIVIFDEIKQYFVVENFSLYSSYLVLNNLYYYEKNLYYKINIE